MLAHAGVGLAVIGIVSTTAWRSEAILAMKPGETADIAGYTLAFKGVERAPGAELLASVPGCSQCRVMARR